MSNVPLINNIFHKTASNTLNTGKIKYTTNGNIQFDEGTYHLAQNTKLQNMQEFVKNGMQALIDKPSSTFSAEA